MINAPFFEIGFRLKLRQTADILIIVEPSYIQWCCFIAFCSDLSRVINIICATVIHTDEIHY